MNRTKLKNYAPLARREFMQAITDRAAFYGLTANKIEDVTAQQGDVAIIGGKPFPLSILEKRHKLIERINRNGFAPTMEAIAYTWFNRFVAIRFMELHGYLDHGYRVLSVTTDYTDSTDGLKTSVSSVQSVVKPPEILLHAEHIALPGLNRDKVIELKLDGTKEAELYRLLLVAQCNALSAAMPFLFERVDDETELLLPDNLLHSDSLIRKLVNEIDESDWQQVEIIGWLYQFYISEKKDEVIGKVVKSEDIPAATQLFTPNWIVKYLVQNSIGRMWMEANPASNLPAKMEYYIELRNADDGLRNADWGLRIEENKSAIQPPQSAISNLQSAIHHPQSVLSPEAITVLDPACGSGHILVEAYDLLKEIYLERGYRLRDIPRLILSKNLFGLDIDDRAAQLASFALLMKARADDRRIFDRANGSESAIPNPHSAIVNVLTIPDSSALSLRPHQLAESLFSDKARRGAIPIRDAKYLFGEMEAQPSLLMMEESSSPQSAIPNPHSAITEQHLIDLLERFELGKTLGSLIRLPADYGPTLAAMAELIADKRAHGDIYEKIAARQIAPFARAAELLHAKYDCVIANPPYMGGKGMNAELKAFAARNFPDSKSDLFAMFIERNFELTKRDGFNAMLTMQSWMFLSSYEKLREKLLSEKTITDLTQIGYNSFPSLNSKIAQAVVFTALNQHLPDYTGVYVNLNDAPQSADKEIVFKQSPKTYFLKQDEFKKIPGSPIAYWTSNKVRESFEKGTTLYDIAPTKQGLATGDNDRFLRYWFEVNLNTITFNAENSEQAKKSKNKWFPCNKGGLYRKWFGNNEYVVNWENDGCEIKNLTDEYGNQRSRPQNTTYYFREGITWSSISSNDASFRYSPQGRISETKGAMCFVKDAGQINKILSFLNTPVVTYFLKIFSPTLDFHEGPVGKLPISFDDSIKTNSDETVSIARADWDSFETSWDFQTFPLLRSDLKAATVEQSFLHWQHACQANMQRMQELETENNRLFIDAYGLQDELSPEVPEAQITLARADRSEDTKRLLSYALGCMMGRYSLDRAGLVYADSGNRDFEKIYWGIAECGLGIADWKDNSGDEASAVSAVADTLAACSESAIPNPHSAIPNPKSAFPPDADGIIPVTEIEWFADDAAHRFSEFIGKAWSGEQLEANLRWIAESLGISRDEDARDTIRRYFSNGFFKDHLKTYKKRPIYWLFSSGKQRAFQCLVYLHRYNEGTLARMRTEYVIPLQGKFSGRITQLENDKAAATSTSHRKKLEKEQDTLKKQQTELITFDEKLRHFADQKIALDLDDGVKVNYGKFGDLLAEVKAVTGGSDE